MDILLQEILKNMNPNLKDVIEKSQGKIITDVGCGCGENLVYSSKYAYKLIGMDLSRRSLDFLLKNLYNLKI